MGEEMEKEAVFSSMGETEQVMDGLETQDNKIAFASWETTFQPQDPAIVTI